MHRHLRAIAVRCILTGGLLVGLVAFAPVASAGDPCFHRMDNRPAVTTAATTLVAIDDCSFGPTVTWVPEGSKVTWRNVSTQGHEIVGSNMTWGAHEKVLEPGDSMGWTFGAAGVYAYSCMLHPGMTGAVVVGDASAPKAATDAGADAATVGSAGAPPTSNVPGAGALAAGGAVALLALLGVAAATRRQRSAPDVRA